MALKSSRVALKHSSQPSYIGFNVHMCILGERRQRAGASSKTEGNALTSALPSSLYTSLMYNSIGRLWRSECSAKIDFFQSSEFFVVRGLKSKCVKNE